MPKAGERTEKPTAKRKKQSRREGNVARSQDVGTALSFMGLLVVFMFMGKSIFTEFAESTSVFLRASAQGSEQSGLAREAWLLIARTLGPILGLTVLAAIIASVAQTGFIFSPKALKPKLKNLNPKQGLEKFKPTKMLWELVRTSMKAVFLVVIVWGPVQEMSGTIGSNLTMTGWLLVLSAMIKSLLIRAAVLTVIVALGDYLYNRHKMNKQLKMTKQEVKDEFKQAEGDPQIKGQRRAKAREMSRNRMLTDVSSASVVIVNPVRFAVALRYNPGESAPVVVAKGAGRFAFKIRAEAYRNAIPVRQDPPLARAIYRRCKVGQPIPGSLFEAVAVILAAIHHSKARRRSVAMRGTAA